MRMTLGVSASAEEGLARVVESEVVEYSTTIPSMTQSRSNSMEEMDSECDVEVLSASE